MPSRSMATATSSSATPRPVESVESTCTTESSPRSRAVGAPSRTACRRPTPMSVLYWRSRSIRAGICSSTRPARTQPDPEDRRRRNDRDSGRSPERRRNGCRMWVDGRRWPRNVGSTRSGLRHGRRSRRDAVSRGHPELRGSPGHRSPRPEPHHDDHDHDDGPGGDDDGATIAECAVSRIVGGGCGWLGVGRGWFVGVGLFHRAVECSDHAPGVDAVGEGLLAGRRGRRGVRVRRHVVPGFDGADPVAFAGGRTGGNAVGAGLLVVGRRWWCLRVRRRRAFMARWRVRRCGRRWRGSRRHRRVAGIG